MAYDVETRHQRLSYEAPYLHLIVRSKYGSALVFSTGSIGLKSPNVIRRPSYLLFCSLQGNAKGGSLKYGHGGVQVNNLIIKVRVPIAKLMIVR